MARGAMRTLSFSINSSGSSSRCVERACPPGRACARASLGSVGLGPLDHRFADAAADPPSGVDIAPEMNARPEPRLAELARPAVVVRRPPGERGSRGPWLRPRQGWPRSRDRSGRVGSGPPWRWSDRTDWVVPPSSGIWRPATRSSSRSGPRAPARRPGAARGALPARPASGQPDPDLFAEPEEEPGLAVLAELRQRGGRGRAVRRGRGGRRKAAGPLVPGRRGRARTPPRAPWTARPSRLPACP